MGYASKAADRSVSGGAVMRACAGFLWSFHGYVCCMEFHYFILV